MSLVTRESITSDAVFPNSLQTQCLPIRIDCKNLGFANTVILEFFSLHLIKDFVSLPTVSMVEIYHSCASSFACNTIPGISETSPCSVADGCRYGPCNVTAFKKQLIWAGEICKTKVTYFQTING